MQINSKNYNSKFHDKLIDAAKNYDVNRLIQLLILEIGTLELDAVTTHLLSDVLQLAKYKSPIGVAEGLKFRRKLMKGAQDD
jgi:hypothetical protein